MLSKVPSALLSDPDGFKLYPVNDFRIFTGFSCGNSDLDDFILNDAATHAQELVAVTYAFFLDSKESPPLAFISLLNDTVKIPGRVKRAIPKTCHYRTYPAVKIGRLGVRKELRRQKIGERLLSLVLPWLAHESPAGCRIVILDAYQEAIPFYQHCGFQFLTREDADEETRLLFLDLLRYRIGV